MPPVRAVGVPLNGPSDASRSCRMSFSSPTAPQQPLRDKARSLYLQLHDLRTAARAGEALNEQVPAASAAELMERIDPQRALTTVATAAVRTPTIACEELTAAVGGSLALKAECL